MTADTAALHLVLIAASIATVGAYACRLGALHLREHRPAAIALHLALGWLAVWSAWAWAADPQPAAVLALAVSALWIAATLPEWRHGVPRWARRLPADPPPSSIHVDPLSR